MKTISAAFALIIVSSHCRADQTANFAAVSLTSDQSMRAIISNVMIPPKGVPPAPCQVQVSFFGADGSLIGDAKTVQLKAGESTSVPLSEQSVKLARAVVSTADVDLAGICELKTSVEIFDKETGTTFNSILGESIGITSDAGRKAVLPATAIPHLVAPSSDHRASPKARPPVLDVPKSIRPR